jgi:Phosphopantetheine attachment site
MPPPPREAESIGWREVDALASDLAGLRRDDFALAEVYVEPRKGTESVIGKMWRQAMGFDKVGVHDSFFELGGKSFAAAVIFSEIERHYGVHMPMGTMMELPTIAQLARRIDELSGQGGD